MVRRLVLLLLLLAGVALAPAQAAPPVPATAQSQANLLTYFKSIQGKGMISGQFIEVNNRSCCDFDASIQVIHDSQTTPKQWVGFVGIDFWTSGDGSASANCNAVAQANSYWTTQQGLVTATTAMSNPQTGGAANDTTMNATNLLTTGTATNIAWLARVDSIGVCLAQMNAQGVVPLTRIYHEVIPCCWWWNSNNFTPTQYQQLWTTTVNRLRAGQTSSPSGQNYAPILALFSYVNNGTAGYYPGDSVVDVVGIDAYSNSVWTDYLSDYNNAVATGKPVWMSEFGPNSPGSGDPGYDENLMINGVKANMPNIFGFQQWLGDATGTPGWCMCISSNVSAALNNTYSINAGNIAFFSENTNPTGSVLPAGFLNVLKNQITDGAGNPVRIASWNYDKNIPVTGSFSSDLAIIRSNGPNTIRYPWYDKATCPNGTCSFTTLDALVTAAAANSMRVIFYHAGNEGNSTCLQRQGNGLWYDKNDVAPYNVTNNTDGCSTPITGTVTYAQFKANWVSIAAHYSGNTTVIGFDLHQEPNIQATGGAPTTALNWSGIFASSPVTPTATRNPYFQPGSNVSAWNTPFGSGATWSAPTDADTIDIARGWNGSNYTAGPVGIINDPTNFGTTYYIGGASGQGTYKFSSNFNGRSAGPAPDNGSTITVTVALPTGAVSPGPSGGDNPMIFEDYTNAPNRQYTFGQVVNGSGGYIQSPGLQPGQGPFTGSQGEWDDITSDTYGEDQETQLYGFNIGDGMITACDVTPSCNPNYPNIRHALRYATDAHLLKSNATDPSNGCTLAPNSWPQRCQDGQTGINVYSGNLFAGATLGIPSTTAMPAGLDTNCQAYFHDRQHYPMFFRDQAGGGLHLTVDQTAYASSYITSIQGCLPQIDGLLRVLTNQHQGGQDFTVHPTNGPGTRVDPGPAQLCATSAGQCTGVTPPSGNRIVAPLTGTVNAGSWTAYNITTVTLPSGKWFRYYLLPPANLDTTKIYPLMVWEHPDHEGDPYYEGCTGTCNGGKTGDESQGSNIVNNITPPINFNTTSFRTSYPMWVMVVLADQTTDPSSGLQNWGGWTNSGATCSRSVFNGVCGPDSYGVTDSIKDAIANQTQGTVDTTRIYGQGFSLGGIGMAYQCDVDNQYSGTVGKVFAGCISTAGVEEYNGYGVGPTTGDATRIGQSQLWMISGSNDGASIPSHWALPVWQKLTSNTNYPTTNPGVIGTAASTQAGSTGYHLSYINGGGHTDQNNGVFYEVNTNAMNWLYSQIGPGIGSYP